MEIFTPSTIEEIESCFDAFAALRPHISRDSFPAQVERQQAQGYRIVALRVGQDVVSAAGFRINEFLAWGKVLYIDDLTTVPEARGSGYADQILKWVIQHGREQGCDAVHLDSGYTRQAAHRLYLRNGFALSSHHFSLSLSL